MELMNSNVEDQVMETGMKPYEKPRLIRHGTIGSITGGGDADALDFDMSGIAGDN